MVVTIQNPLDPSAPVADPYVAELLDEIRAKGETAALLGRLALRYADLGQGPRSVGALARIPARTPDRLQVAEALAGRLTGPARRRVLAELAVPQSRSLSDGFSFCGRGAPTAVIAIAGASVALPLFCLGPWLGPTGRAALFLLGTGLVSAAVSDLLGRLARGRDAPPAPSDAIRTLIPSLVSWGPVWAAVLGPALLVGSISPLAGSVLLLAGPIYLAGALPRLLEAPGIGSLRIGSLGAVRRDSPGELSLLLAVGALLACTLVTALLIGAAGPGWAWLGCLASQTVIAAVVRLAATAIDRCELARAGV